MSLSFALYLLVVGGLVAISAASLDTVFRRWGQPTRWIWIAAMATLVAFAVAAPRRHAPMSSVPLPIQLTLATDDARASKTSAVAVYFLEGQRWADAMLATAFAEIETRVPPAVVQAGAVLWMTSSALVLLLLVGVHVQMSRARRAWDVFELHGTRVLVAPVAGPAVIGVTRPEIVLPRWLLERDADEQRLVLAHEREHVAARDHLLLIALWLLAAAMPWHPAVWWMAERLRLAMELDCDARVLRRGVPARRYGLLLIDIAGRYRGYRAGALALADRNSHLERRLKAMTTTRSRFAIVRASALTAVAVLSLLAACEAKLPTSAQVDAMDAASATSAATKSQLLSKVDGAPIYIVDGSQVTEFEANAIPATRIATVNITKGTAGSASSIIIRTKSDTLQATGLIASRTRDTSAAVVPAGKLAVKVRGTGLRQFEGLVYIDGVLSSNKDFSTMDRDRIASVEVIKGVAASNISSDPAAANGIIRITTKTDGVPR